MSHRHPASVRRVRHVAMATSLSAVVFIVAGGDSVSLGQPGAEPALPDEMVVIDIDAPEERVYRIGVPDLDMANVADGVTTPLGPTIGEIVRNDFRLMPGYQVIDPRSMRHDLVAEGLGIRTGAWVALGANGVIKGEVRGGSEDDTVEVELRFFRVSAPEQAALTRVYRGAPSSARRWAHDFGNQVLRLLTGLPGPFGTEIAFARRIGPGRKDVLRAQMDGYGERRISRGEGISLLPAFGDGVIWFTRMTTRGMYLTHGRTRDRPLITGDGINMAPTVCDGRIYFTSSRDGNPEIYSANPDGSDVRRLTDDPAMDLSPACGPDGLLAFVSTRHRTPQIFTMNRDGSDVQRVTFRGTHNQTPTFCADPARRLLAFTGRDRGYDVFTLDLRTHEYTRLTQGQGDNKDPAFSPDCRMIAYASDRAGAPGVYVAGLMGQNAQRVIAGAAETVRWRRWDTFPERGRGLVEDAESDDGSVGTEVSTAP